jgi:hypothetical protein
MSAAGKRMSSLACLALISLVFYYDRGVVVILLEPLKHDLRLSDGQIGLITGLAFIILASVVAVVLLPISVGHRVPDIRRPQAAAAPPA